MRDCPSSWPRAESYGENVPEIKKIVTQISRLPLEPQLTQALEPGCKKIKGRILMGATPFRPDWRLGVGGQVAGLLGGGGPAGQHLEAVGRRSARGRGVGEQGQAGGSCATRSYPPPSSARPGNSTSPTPPPRSRSPSATTTCVPSKSTTPRVSPPATDPASAAPRAIRSRWMQVIRRGDSQTTRRQSVFFFRLLRLVP